MIKKNLLSILGLIASSLLILFYCINIIGFLAFNRTFSWMLIFNTLSPFLLIIIFLTLRHILVNISRLYNFKILLTLLIIFQTLILLLMLGFKFQVVTTKILTIPFMLSGFIVIILTIWFFISVSYISKNEVTGLSFLQLYAISALLVLLLSIVPEILIFLKKGDSQSLDIIRNIAVIVPYIFLSIFFLKSLLHDNNPDVN